MKKKIRDVVLSTLLRPPYVRHCNQTIYEAFLSCLRMYTATGQELWKERSYRLMELQLQNQLPDGGFEIGYSFYFGKIHKKGHGTSPDMMSLFAMVEFWRLFGENRVHKAIRRNVDWFKRNALELEDGLWASPYCPDATRSVMIYNGTSFATGAIGYYLGRVGNDPELRRMYEGMIRYLDGVMSVDPDFPGRFWYYADQTRTDLTEFQRRQIDYYHQCQQIEIHAAAQQVAPVPAQLDMIRDAADHIVAIQDRHGILPYMNLDVSPTATVQVWGLCSAIPGLLEASSVLPDRRETYTTAARFVLDWLLDNAWTGEYFLEVLSRKGTISPSHRREYMVRSNAWVVNALAVAQNHLGNGRWTEFIEPCYQKMEDLDFSGPENHATNARKRFFSALMKLLKGTK